MPDLFNLIIMETDPDTKHPVNVETYNNVSVNDGDSRYLPGVLEQQSQLVSVIRDSISGEYEMPDVRPLETSTEITAISSSVSTNGREGHDGAELTTAQYNGSGLRNNKEGLYALEKADLFNILCIPPFTMSNDIGTDLIADAISYCKERRAFFIIDSPASWTTKNAAKDAFTATSNAYPGSRSSNAAIFLGIFPILTP